LPYEIKEKSVMLMSDIHFPYHDVRALETAIDYAVGKNITAIMLNGDVLDMFKLSRYSKNPKARDFNGELEMLKDFITMLKTVFKVPIYYKMGNHEERYNDFLYAKAGELVGLDEFNLESVIKKRVGDGVELISDKRIVKIGKLNVVHGHEFTGGFVAPVNIARGLYLKAKVSTIQGHNHQTSEHTEPDLNGGLTTTWSLGCLCHLHPSYMPVNRWNHGFAIVEVFEDSIFQVSNKRIQNGRVY
jgi:predicted phosphodiesterase